MLTKTPFGPEFWVTQFRAVQDFYTGLSRYQADFLVPYLISLVYFSRAEMARDPAHMGNNAFKDYLSLLEFSTDLWGRGVKGSVNALGDFLNSESQSYARVLQKSMTGQGADELADYLSGLATRMSGVSHTLPDAVRDIEPAFGFHFDTGNHPLAAETDRFRLFRILPDAPGIKSDATAKPVLILPPYVLGCNILGFLPGDRKSYAHAFANRGVPTYIRVMKDIRDYPACQTMTMEEDTLDTRYFCDSIKRAHGKPVTLNGYCQGGFLGLCQILSGELDGLVDALITCVAPMDGTRSKGLKGFLDKLPRRFNDLAFGTKTLPNGNRVADGKLMGWVYKLKSIEDQAPLALFLRDMLMVAKMTDRLDRISNTAAALNYWLRNERADIPLALTEMSFASYNIPITADGTLPVTLFGRQLTLKDFPGKSIPWLLCYGEDDDLVEKEAALAPLDHIDVETTPFPKGHVAIATSWSHPDSPYPLHGRFGPENQYRGPVRFHLDLNES
ncbi:MAG TPA: metal transporter [Desulfobacteraceae bacterium]|nr:metal transporter [Desulfobacteraceae bacterium]